MRDRTVVEAEPCSGWRKLRPMMSGELVELDMQVGIDR
jgi:hypothetical protein